MPSSLAVIIVVPGVIAYTLPSWSTEATFSLLEDQTGALPEDIDIPIWKEEPASNVILLSLSFISGFST